MIGVLRTAGSSPAARTYCLDDLFALVAELESRAPVIQAAAARRDYKDAFANIAQLQPVVAKFFDDVLVMADDERLRAARLGLVATLRDLILDIADISEIVTES